MNDTLLAAIERHETLASSYGDLSDERSTALDYYLGKPLGNEVEGRSAVISRDVWDTVEWIKPQLADIFCGGDQVVMFSPTGPEDVKAAEQETEFVNHIITEKNDWFTTWYGWSHDALLQKVGYVIAYYEDREDRTKEKYQGLSEDEAALMLQDSSVSIVEAEQVPTEYGLTFNLTIERVASYGCVKFENVAPERVLISHNARGLNLQDPRLDFCEYWEYKTISELRDEGFKVDDDLSDHADGAQDWEDERRDALNPWRNSEGDESSPAARRLKVRNVWIRFDSDDDGLTELRRVVVVGTTILSDEECDQVTLVALCPVPLPHQHAGLSMAEAVMDLQRIKTALLRGSLDNLYLANNGRHVIDEDAINLDDMLVSRPGGVVRKKAGVSMADAIMPLTHSAAGDIAVPMMEYMDRISQKRTGVNEQSQGLDPNTLNKTATGAQMLMGAAQQRIKFIARIFAETGVKALFRVVHALTLKNARKAEIVQLRNQWVPVDPRSWKKRENMSISVGLGTGDRPQQIAFLMQVLGIQTQALQFGLTGPDKVYNTLKRLTQAGGFKDPNEFWSDPSMNPPQPPGPPPEVLKEQAKVQGQAQIEQMKAQSQSQLEQMRIGAELQLKREEFGLKMQELQANLQLQQSNDVRDAERERLRAEQQAQIDAMKLQFDREKADLEAQITKYKTDQDNATKLQIAGMSAEQSSQSQALQIAHDAAQKESDRVSKAHEAKEGAKQEKAREEVKPDPRLDKLLEVTSKIADEMNAPAEIVRGPDGKAVGVKRGDKVRNIVRDENGRAKGLE